MAGRFALQHMHPLNLWIQPSPMPQCLLNWHNKALGPAIMPKRQLQIQPFGPQSCHCHENLSLALSMLWLSNAPLPITIIDRPSKIFFINVMKASPWKHALEPPFLHTTIKQTPRKPYTHESYPLSQDTKTFITHYCHPILHQMTQRPLSYTLVILSSISKHKDFYHTPMSSYPPPHDTENPILHPYLSSIPWHKGFYHTPISSYPPPHDTKTLITHSCNPIFHPMTQGLL